MISMDMKQMNRKAVFDIVRKKRNVTRRELEKMTGMSGPSIMAIVNEFVDRGILIEKGKKNGSLGRSPVMLEFIPEVILSIGVEFDGDTLLAGVVNLDGEILFQTLEKVSSNLTENFYNALCKCIDRLEVMMEKEGLTYSGIGLGIPGVVNSEDCVVYFAPYIGIEEPTDISGMLQSISMRYGKSVFIENDVNASAMGEYYLSIIQKEIQDMVYVSIGSGIGAGIILDGRLRHGANWLCGEIGYLIKDVSSPVSKKDRGWLETSLSKEVLREKFAEYQSEGEISSKMREYIADILSPFIANLINALDINEVVFGGQLVKEGGEALILALKNKIRKLSLSEVDIHGCKLEYTGVVGSALLASNRLWRSIL